MDPETVDAELLAAVAAGDQRAFAALYDRYSRQAYSLARRVCVDPDFADEAVQEAFLVVWKDPGRFDPARGGFASWLLMLVHHRSVDVVRRQSSHRRRHLLGMDEFADGVLPAEAGADERAMTNVVGGLVRKALDELSAEQRQVIGLAYLGGYTQAEVSAITGLPLGTVKSRTFAGIKRLRDLLAGLGRRHDGLEVW
ncbi:sigma-70 family RNA polymerase sigma factor [Kutzneria sp. NPDC052558]|uniref:sigma-70 family RNA polymerase sigma factor n=1 Tax=Kutzneria sp. NPDC052558 TaxID=3364121 RepID=UPI0037C59B79